MSRNPCGREKKKFTNSVVLEGVEISVTPSICGSTATPFWTDGRGSQRACADMREMPTEASMNDSVLVERVAFVAHTICF